MRWDVPAIGPDTMRSFKASGARCLGIEAGKTYILDPDETLAMADELGVTRERVRQIQLAALERLHEILEEEGFSVATLF